MELLAIAPSTTNRPFLNLIILFVFLSTAFQRVLYGKPLTEACGSESSVAIQHSALLCAQALRKDKERSIRSDACVPPCQAVRSAIQTSFNPTLCQKEALEALSAFNDQHTQKAYIQKCTPKWPIDAVGFAVAGSAYGILYYFGAMDGLIESGILYPNASMMGGLSGGTLASLGICAGFTPYELQQEFSRLFNLNLVNYNNSLQIFPGQGTAMDNLLRISETAFPANSSAWKICSERVNIWTTVLDPSDPTMRTNRPYSVGKVESARELHEAIAASGFIPCGSGCAPYVTFRNKPMIDGAFAVSFAELCPTGIKRCIAMESYYIGPYRKPGGEECNEKVEQDTDSEEMRVLFCNLPPPKGMKTVPIGNLPLACPVVVPSIKKTPQMADIHPGKYRTNPVPVTCQKWQDMAFFPDPDYYNALFALGHKDAIEWAKEQKLAA